MRVDVVRAMPEIQTVVSLDLADGATVADALAAAGMSADVDAEHVGIWNRRVTLDASLRDGDRVECYRPLIADPKAARRGRAAANPVGVQSRRRINRS